MLTKLNKNTILLFLFLAYFGCSFSQLRLYQCSFCVENKVNTVKGIPFTYREYSPCNPYNLSTILNKSLIQTIYLLFVGDSVYYCTKFDLFSKPYYKEYKTNYNLLSEIYNNTIFDLTSYNKNILHGTSRTVEHLTELKFKINSKDSFSLLCPTINLYNSLDTIKLLEIDYTPNQGTLTNSQILPFLFNDVFNSASKFQFISLNYMYIQWPFTLNFKGDIAQFGEYKIKFFKTSNLIASIIPLHFFPPGNIIQPKVGFVYDKEFPPYKTNFAIDVLNKFYQKLVIHTVNNKDTILTIDTTKSILTEVIKNQFKDNYFNYYKDKFQIRKINKNSKETIELMNFLSEFFFLSNHDMINKFKTNILVQKNNLSRILINKKYSFFNTDTLILDYINSPAYNKIEYTNSLFYNIACDQSFQTGNTLTDYIKRLFENITDTTGKNYLEKPESIKDIAIEKFRKLFSLNIEIYRDSLFKNIVKTELKKLNYLALTDHTRKLANLLQSKDSNNLKKISESVYSIKNKSTQWLAQYNLTYKPEDSIARKTIPEFNLLLDTLINKLINNESIQYESRRTIIYHRQFDISEFHLKEKSILDTLYKTYSSTLSRHIYSLIKLANYTNTTDSNKLFKLITQQLKKEDNWNYYFKFNNSEILQLCYNIIISSELKSSITSEDYIRLLSTKFKYYLESSFYPYLFSTKFMPNKNNEN